MGILQSPSFVRPPVLTLLSEQRFGVFAIEYGTLRVDFAFENEHQLKNFFSLIMEGIGTL